MNTHHLLRAGAACCLAVVLASPALGAWNFPGDIRPGHTPLGNYYDGWITDTDDVLVDWGGDVAYLWKDLDLASPVASTLYLGYDDGAMVWLNGMLVMDDQWAEHGVGYWDAILDLGPYLANGRNRLAIKVLNACQGGCCEGGLDLELWVDGVAVMPMGSASPLDPANEIWYTGGVCDFVPPLDEAGLPFEAMDYGWTDDLVSAKESPLGFALAPAFPNPFNPVTTLSYTLSATGPATLSVHDLLGREVAVLASGLQEAGEHRLSFDAAGLPGGLYLARLQTETGSQTRKLLLVK